MIRCQRPSERSTLASAAKLVVLFAVRYLVAMFGPRGDPCHVGVGTAPWPVKSWLAGDPPCGATTTRPDWPRTRRSAGCRHRRVRVPPPQSHVQRDGFGVGLFEVAEAPQGEAQLPVDPLDGVSVAGLVGRFHAELVEHLPVRGDLEGLTTGPVSEAVLPLVEEELSEVLGRFGHPGLDGEVEAVAVDPVVGPFGMLGEGSATNEVHGLPVVLDGLARGGVAGQGGQMLEAVPVGGDARAEAEGAVLGFGHVGAAFVIDAEGFAGAGDVGADGGVGDFVAVAGCGPEIALEAVSLDGVVPGGEVGDDLAGFRSGR